MKINNPTKFFPAETTDPSYIELKNRATIMTRGDVLRKFAVTDSSIESDWHFTENSQEDTWVKFSFDAGRSYPLKFKYKNTLLMKFVKPGAPVAGTSLEFDFADYADHDYSSIKNGRISVYALNNENYVTTLPCYRYKFDDATRKLNVVVTMDPPIDSEATMVLIELDGHSAMAMAVPTPVFSSFVSFSNTTYTEDHGYVLLLGHSSDPSDALFTATTNFDNVTELYVKIVSADSSVVGVRNVELEFSCGNRQFTQLVPVTTVETWQKISLEGPLNGALTITRNSGSSNDTLKDASNGVIDCYITNVKAVVFS